MIVRRAFSPPDNERLAHVCGALDENLRAIEQGLNVVITRRQEHFRVEGGKLQAPRALALIEALYERSGRPIDEEQLQLMLYEAQRDVIQGHAKPVAPAEAAAGGEIVLHTRRADLIGRTPNQVQYLRQILSHDITLGLGPAGTGKTFLAVACAVDALERSARAAHRADAARRSRPASGSASCPATCRRRSIRTCARCTTRCYDLMGFERVTKAFERGAIEIAPLAFMRGRTLNHAFVILDEAQNTTPEQMKMFLTRIGFGTKAVVTGDLTQIDLPRGARSGLADASEILRDVARHRHDAVQRGRRGAPSAGGAHRRGLRGGRVAQRGRAPSERPNARRPRRPRSRKAGAAAAEDVPDGPHRAARPATEPAVRRRRRTARCCRATRSRAGSAPASSCRPTITVRIVGEDEGRALNRDYRRKDYATNVLTFDYVQEPEIEADLVLCAPVVEREATEQKIDARRPLRAPAGARHAARAGLRPRGRRPRGRVHGSARDRGAGGPRLRRPLRADRRQPRLSTRAASSAK